jgi:hypothetical protein
MNAAKQILQADLPPASVEDNLRFYRILRTRLGAADDMPHDAEPRK